LDLVLFVRGFLDVCIIPSSYGIHNKSYLQDRAVSFNTVVGPLFFTIRGTITGSESNGYQSMGHVLKFHLVFEVDFHSSTKGFTKVHNSELLVLLLAKASHA
jgi:hypothetical protein